MKTISHIYQNIDTLKYFIESDMKKEDTNILVQIFSGIVKKDILIELSSNLQNLLPNANIIGATTAGEILHGEMLDKQILITFSLFETTSVETALVDFSIQETFADIEKSILEENTKALIIFSDGLKSNAEGLLEYLTINYPEIVVAGGRAADFLKAEQTYVFNSDKCIDNGFVIASLSGDDLIVNSDYLLNWNPIGKEMTITKANANIVHTIDNIPIKKLYEKYLGPEVTKNLPMSVTEFPLLSIKNGIKKARAPIAVLEDIDLEILKEYAVDA